MSCSKVSNNIPRREPPSLESKRKAYMITLKAIEKEHLYTKDVNVVGLLALRGYKEYASNFLIIGSFKFIL